MMYAFLFSIACFLMALAGASIVFLLKKENKKLDVFLNAFSSGVMISSSVFSLIIPAINYCQELNLPVYVVLPPSFFICGLVFVLLNKFSHESQETKISSKMVMLGVAIHNVPEGICLGLAFASASVLGTQMAFMSAVMIALGIGIQNIPEGSTVAFTTYSKNKNKLKAFFSSALAAIVEVVACFISYFVGVRLMYVMPFMLSFAGATMLIIAVCDLMPDAIEKNKPLSLIYMVLGLTAMMLLVLLLG